MNNYKYGLLILFFSTHLTGCATKYNPDPSIAQGLVEGIVIQQPFTITNSQTSSESHKLHFGQAIVNYREFTESLVQALNQAYGLSADAASRQSDKNLQVSVTDIESIISGLGPKFIVSAEVASGEQLIEYFDVYGSDDLDDAFKELVTAILQNEKIIAYLNE